jgi:hypothetical protein
MPKGDFVQCSINRCYKNNLFLVAVDVDVEEWQQQPAAREACTVVE